MVSLTHSLFLTYTTHLYLCMQYHPLGSSEDISAILVGLKIDDERIDAFTVRLNLALDYLSIIAYLHASPEGTMVMCDGDHVEKLMSQFLITRDTRLIVNDLDALPMVDRYSQELVEKCGHRAFQRRSFIAPEQLWPFDHIDFRFASKLPT